MKTDVDVLVIGAGPAGTIAASIIHKAGLSVHIIEKMRFPRFVIGESLLPRCMEALDEAGLIETVTERHFQKKEGAKFVYGDRLCDFNFAQQYTAGWNWTWQVTRADFDKTLADECERKGIPVQYEKEVTAITIKPTHAEVTIKGSDGTPAVITAKFIVDGSGYGRVIPRLFGLERPSQQPSRRAVFCHITDTHRAEADEPDRITIGIHKEDVWFWVIPFSNGNTSVGYVGNPVFFDQFTGTAEEQFMRLMSADQNLVHRFSDQKMVWPEPRSLQGWSTTTDTFYGDKFVLTGNVTEFLDPVFSSGVTLASASAQRAAQLVVRHLSGAAVDWEEEYAAYMKKGIDVFRTYVNNWYDGTLFDIFFAAERDEKVMAQICSVLAGYVWDESNPFVKYHEKNIRTLGQYMKHRQVSQSGI